MNHRMLLLVLAILTAPSSARAQPAIGEVRQLGFRAASATGCVIREGQWFPILVEASAQGSEHLAVSLRCEQMDLDADRVGYLQGPVVLTSGGPPRRVWCYAVAHSFGLLQATTLDIVAEDGALLNSIALPQFDVVANDTQLILDISERPVTALRTLDSGPIGYTERAWGQRRFYRQVCVANLATGDLPDQWFGLEAVDVLVWDEPNPGILTQGQIDALVRWVQAGGQLVLGIGGAWSRLQADQSGLAVLLPLARDASGVEVNALPIFQQVFGTQGALESPLSVPSGSLARGAALFKDRLPDGRVIPLISMQFVGSGRVIATAASLRELFQLTHGPGAAALLNELIDLNPMPAEVNAAESASILNLQLVSRDLFPGLIRPVEFSSTGSLFTLVALGFVAMYIVAAVFLSWFWLNRHGLSHLSWSVFAGFAVVASVLSLGAVAGTRGFRHVASEVALLDLEAGSSEARGACYFGYRSPARQRVRLDLPGERNYLRPMAPKPRSNVFYATPERYSAFTGKAQLDDVPMRATLKQFEGHWEGTLRGAVRAQLAADRGTGRITPESWILNDLDGAIAGGYLLYMDPRLVDARTREMPVRLAGRTQSYRGKYNRSERVPVAVNVLCLKLPELKPGAQVRGLGAGEYGIVEREQAAWAVSAAKDPGEMPDLPTLWDRQTADWAPRPIAVFGGIDETWSAALLASTRDLYLHNAQTFDSVGVPATTENMVDQDVTHWLVRGYAVLLLISEEGGPPALQRDGQDLSARDGKTLYRVRVPLEYTGSPAGAAP